MSRLDEQTGWIDPSWETQISRVVFDVACDDDFSVGSHVAMHRKLAEWDPNTRGLRFPWDGVPKMEPFLLVDETLSPDTSARLRQTLEQLRIRRNLHPKEALGFLVNIALALVDDYRAVRSLSVDDLLTAFAKFGKRYNLLQPSQRESSLEMVGWTFSYRSSPPSPVPRVHIHGDHVHWNHAVRQFADEDHHFDYWRWKEGWLNRKEPSAEVLMRWDGQFVEGSLVQVFAAAVDVPGAHRAPDALRPVLALLNERLDEDSGWSLRKDLQEVRDSTGLSFQEVLALMLLADLCHLESLRAQHQQRSVLELLRAVTQRWAVGSRYDDIDHGLHFLSPMQASRDPDAPTAFPPYWSLETLREAWQVHSREFEPLAWQTTRHLKAVAPIDSPVIGPPRMYLRDFRFIPPSWIDTATLPDHPWPSVRERRQVFTVEAYRAPQALSTFQAVASRSERAFLAIVTPSKREEPSGQPLCEMRKRGKTYEVSYRGNQVVPDANKRCLHASKGVRQLALLLSHRDEPWHAWVLHHYVPKTDDGTWDAEWLDEASLEDLKDEADRADPLNVKEVHRVVRQNIYRVIKNLGKLDRLLDRDLDLAILEHADKTYPYFRYMPLRARAT